MRVVVAVAVFALGGAGVVVACSSFEGSVSVADAGAPDTGTAETSDPGPPDTGPRPAVLEASAPCTESCASRTCDDAGACFPLVFVTAGKVQGDMGGNDGGLVTADALCNAEAKAAGRNGVFRAWLSTSKADALERVQESPGRTRPVIDSTGAVVAPFYPAMNDTDGGLYMPINHTAEGAILPAEEIVWTGTYITGGLGDSSCFDWTYGSNGQAGHTGKASYTDKNWTDQGDTECIQSHRLYCFELAP